MHKSIKKEFNFIPMVWEDHDALVAKWGIPTTNKVFRSFYDMVFLPHAYDYWMKVILYCERNGAVYNE